MSTTASHVTSAIHLAHVTKKFGDFIAVNDVSLDIEKGGIFALLGPNGAGKTTTIKMLTTLLQPTEGDIRINGYDPKTQQDDVRRSFGIVFQDPSLDDELTAYENMMFHGMLFGAKKKNLRARIEELMTFVELWNRKDSLVKEFSGGMKRRLEIARSFLHHPSIIFLDEPTIGLDPQTRNHMWAYIRERNATEKTTIFFTTHYMEEAEKNASRIAIIDHGTIIAQGSAEDLKKETDMPSLEEAFLKLTGKTMRREEASSAEVMRTIHRMWRK